MKPWLEVIVLFMFGILVGVCVGMWPGMQLGMQALHKGVYACQTMPDNSVYCWKVEK